MGSEDCDHKMFLVPYILEETTEKRESRISGPYNTKVLKVIKVKCVVCGEVKPL